MTGHPKPVQVFPGSTDTETSGQFSPDDRWVAYVASEGPNNGNVFVQRYPSSGIKMQISTTTGFNLRPVPLTVIVNWAQGLMKK